MLDAPSVFLFIFVVSFVLTLLSFISGVAHLSIGGHGIDHPHADASHGFHLGHVHVDVPHGADLAHGHVDLPHGGHVDLPPGGHAGHPPHAATDHGGGAEGLSPFNMATILAFLTWFGGAGYLLTAHTGVGTLIAIAVATVVGLAGAAIVFTFMVRILLPGQTPYLESGDYELEGTIGRLTVGIRPGGTGELVYSQGGARRVASARTEDGQPLERGLEVVIVRQEGGIVFVEPFETFVRGATPESARR